MEKVQHQQRAQRIPLIPIVLNDILNHTKTTVTFGYAACNVSNTTAEAAQYLNALHN